MVSSCLRRKHHCDCSRLEWFSFFLRLAEYAAGQRTKNYTPISPLRKTWSLEKISWYSNLNPPNLFPASNAKIKSPYPRVPVFTSIILQFPFHHIFFPAHRCNSNGNSVDHSENSPKIFTWIRDRAFHFRGEIHNILSQRRGNLTCALGLLVSTLAQKLEISRGSWSLFLILGQNTNRLNVASVFQKLNWLFVTVQLTLEVWGSI